MPFFNNTTSGTTGEALVVDDESERLALDSPEGTLVYQTDTRVTWKRSAGYWVPLQLNETWPSGALGLWLAKDYSTDPRPHVPNRATTTAVSLNLLQAPQRLFSNVQFYNKSGVTVVDDAEAAPSGYTEASTLSGTGNWFIGVISLINMPAGTYTVVAEVMRNAGSDQQFCFTADSTSTRSSVKTATDTWIRHTYTFTKGAIFNPNQILLCSIDGSTAADLIISSFELFAGSDDAGTQSAAGHMILGRHSGDTAPSYASGVVDFSTGGFGLVQFVDNIASNTITVSALIQKTATGSGYQSLLSKVQSYLHFSAVTDIGNAPYFGLGLAAADQVGLWDLQDNGWHLITLQGNATESSLWIDDVKLFVGAAITTRTFRDFWVAITNDISLNSGWELAAMALWDRVLSLTEIQNVLSLSAAELAEYGGAVTPVNRILLAEGDSITEYPGFPSYAHRYGANAITPTFGSVRAISGSAITDLETRAASVDAVLPGYVTGRKFILSVMIGRNDLLSLGTSTYLTNLASYCDDRRAAGWTVVVCTILPSTESGFNTARNTVNTTLRTWVGTHCDALVDFDTDPTIGADEAAEDTDYYSDGTHPTAAGQVLLEVVYRAVLNTI